jgi:hypothetical protein
MIYEYRFGGSPQAASAVNAKRRMYELMSGSMNEKDQLYKYSKNGGTLIAELTINVRKSLFPNMIIGRPSRIPPFNSTYTASDWIANDIEAILVGGSCSLSFSQSINTVSILGDISVLDEITNVGYTRLPLTGKAGSGFIPRAQPITQLLSRSWGSTIGLVCDDLVWTGVTAGGFVYGIIIHDVDTDQVLGWIPLSYWDSGNEFDDPVPSFTGASMRFRISQTGIVIMP